MNFTVTYRGASGARTTEVVTAVSREACLAALKARGIVPQSVKEGGETAASAAPAAGPGRPALLKGILAGALVVGLAAGAWFLLGPRGGAPKAEEAEPVPFGSRPKPVVDAPQPESAVATNVSVELNARGRPKHRRKYDAKGNRIFSNPDSPVARSWRSRHGQPPLVDFSEKEDPNAPPPPPPRYRNGLQRQLSEFVNPGQPVGTVDPITDREARQWLAEKVVYDVDDPVSVLNEKKTVEELQEQLREYMDKGGHAREFLEKLQERQDHESAMMGEVAKNVMEFCRQGDEAGAKNALDAYNKYLESKGLPQMKMTHRMKMALRRGGKTAPAAGDSKTGETK